MIIINNVHFSGKLTPDLLKKMINSINKLNPPMIRDEGLELITQENTLLVLQREIAYLQSDISKVQFIGSKNIHSCILVYLYTKNNYCTIHCDTTSIGDKDNFDILFSIIRKFNNNEDINISLVGGYPSTISEKNLENIICALFNVSEKLNINLIIKIFSSKIK